MTKLFASVLNALSGSARTFTTGGRDGGSAPVIDALEPRAMMTVNVLTPLGQTTLGQNAPAAVINLAGRYDDPNLTGTIAKFATVMGDINVLLYDQSASGATRTTPQTVANFLQYINAGRYNNTVFHRTATNFVIQGGGFSLPAADAAAPVAIPTFASVQNEPGNTNIRGTIAMAKQGGNPDSATNQWFFNLANNAANLDSQNGGFTVFGRIINGLSVMDSLASVPVFNFGGAFDTLPLRNYVDQQPEPVARANFLNMTIATIPEITYTVTSSNPTLVAAAINGTNLTLAYGTNLTGTANVTVRATSADGSFVDDIFTVQVNTPPVLGALTPSAANIGRNLPFTLTLASATDDAGITRIDFYRDTNGNGLLETANDTLIGADTSPDGGWNLETRTDDLQLGTHRYFARAVDAEPAFSTVQTTTINVINAAPVLGALTVSPNPAQGRVPLTLSTTATDADGSVAFVRFYRDSDNNGVLNTDTDTLLGEDTNGADGYTSTFDSFALGQGQNRYFAVATDGEGLSGSAVTTTGIIDIPLEVGALTGAPNPILRNQQITLTASEVFIPAGKKLKKIEFYADTNNSGAFEEGIDKKVGSSSSVTNNAATARTSTKGLAAGDFKFFARVQDNLNAWSAITSATVAIVNNNPTLGSVKADPKVVKNLGDEMKLTVSSAKDVDGKIAAIRYYRDTSTPESLADGILNPEGDSLLGTVTSSSSSWRLTLSTAQFSVGVNRFFAVAVDFDGAVSNPVTITNIINAAPVISAFTVSPETGPAATTIYTFSASGVGDPDGTIKQVEIFLDSNGNGTFDNRIDKSLGKAKNINGVWTLTVKGKGFPAAIYKTFARATDNTGGFSPLSTVNFATS